MSTKLSVEISKEDVSTVVTISGVVDESAHFDSSEIPDKSSLVLDFDGLTGINSLGIRTWVRFVNELLEKGCNFKFRNCRSIIIDQVNMVADFAPKGTIFESFYAPFSCDDCNSDVELLFTEKNILENDYSAPKCTTCNEEMEMDALEDEYFIFLEINEG